MLNDNDDYLIEFEDNWSFVDSIWELFESLCTIVGFITFVGIIAFFLGRYT